MRRRSTHPSRRCRPSGHRSSSPARPGAAGAVRRAARPPERRGLGDHLTPCPTCRRAVAALRTGAAAVHTPVTPLPAERAQVILAGALRRRRSGPPVRLLAIAALFALGAGAALAVGA